MNSSLLIVTDRYAMALQFEMLIAKAKREQTLAHYLELSGWSDGARIHEDQAMAYAIAAQEAWERLGL